MNLAMAPEKSPDFFLKGIRDFFEAHEEIVLGWAYGSLVDGRFRAESDLDIAFYSDRITSLETRLDWTEQLQTAFGRRVDLVDLNQTKGLIVKEIMTQGRLLKNSSPDVFAQVLARFYLDEADYGRLRDRAYRERREAVFGECEHTDSGEARPKYDCIARCIQRIESKKPFSPEELANNFDLQDIITTNVTRMVQVAVDVCTMILSRSPAAVPGDMGACFGVVAALGWIDANTAARMRRAVGLRNIIIHEYESVDWNVLHRVTHQHLDDVKSFVKQVSAALVRQG